MGIHNIDDLKPNAAVDPSEPTVPPNEANTQAGVPTPIDNVAKEEAAEQAPEDSATGGTDDGGE